MYDCCEKKRWVCLTCVMALMVIAVSAYFAYQSINKQSKHKEIISRYGSLFRTEEEQFMVEDSLIGAISAVTETSELTNGTCQFSCTSIRVDPTKTKTVYTSIRPYHLRNRQTVQNTPDGRYLDVREQLGINPKHKVLDSHRGLSEIREDPSIVRSVAARQYEYHGCCVSHKEFSSPGRLKNQDGHWRRVVQFQKKRQYFVHDVCSHAQGCTGCQCSQTLTYTTAIVVDYDGADGDDDDVEDNIGRVLRGEEEMDDYRLEMVKMSGACKCFNT